MSEEILQALMELFALIIKQDGGLSSQEEEYVRSFLVQQIGAESAESYFQLFIDTATADQDTKKEKKEGQKLTSVLDSVKILKIGKKISKTLSQRQKIVVLVRAIELINTEYKMSAQRLGIVQTVADVFKIEQKEYESILSFVQDKPENIALDDNILLIRNKQETQESKHFLFSEGLDQHISILRIPSVELYFLQYNGLQEIMLNGRLIMSGVIFILANGSSIRMPVGKPVYYSDITSVFHSFGKTEKLLFEANKLSYTFPGNLKGLDNITFSAQQGNLIGIMGASGAGKTTLLNVLSGNYKPGSGQVSINGYDIHKDEDKLRGMVGYVPQDDLLIEELTVFENLWYNTKFCFNELTHNEILKKVSKTLWDLGLMEKKDLKVGSIMNKTISGGQRKRLNIALELIREPEVLFLDEPTSGLSSRDSEQVMDLLRELSISGKLIFIVIHQPSSELYKMFDQVIILDHGGYMVYYGNPVEAVVHFKKTDNQINYNIGECPVCGNINPEQIFNIIEAQQVDEFGNYSRKRKISPKKWREIFEKEREVKKSETINELPKQKLNLPNWFGQYLNYLKRDLKSKFSNRQYVTMVAGVSPILAFILSILIRYIADPESSDYIFRENENIPIYIFMAIIVALFLGLILSAEEIFRDRKILKREKFLHLSRSSYLLAKISNIMLLSALQTFVFVIIANSILGIAGMTLAYWFALFSIAICANMIGLIISSTFNSAVTIYIIIPLVMIPMMVLSGAMFSFEKLNQKITSVDKVPLIADMMPTKWAYEALMVKQFKDNGFEKNFFEIDREISRTSYKSSYYIPELEERLDILNSEFQEKGKIESNVKALDLLKNEILREQDSLGTKWFEKEDFLKENYTTEFSSNLAQFIEELHQFYLKKYSIANARKQEKLNDIMNDERRALYFMLLNKYHNESISDQVKKIYEKNKILESGERLYQQADPIFLLPEHFRSHFYAPKKRFLGKYFDTFKFNMAIIWSMSVILYIVLYYNLPGRILNKAFFKKKKKNEVIEKA